jgi:hypothetical protein
MFKGRFRIKLNVAYELRDKDGNIKPIFQENALWKFFNKHFSVDWQIPYLFGNWSNQKVVSNLVTSAGQAGIASRINGSGAEAAFTYIALGTGTNAAAAGDTTLQTETSASGLARVAATASRVTTDVSNDTARLTTTFTAGASAALTEAGVFNASSNGTLLARQVFSAVNVVSGDTFTPTWNFDVD